MQFDVSELKGRATAKGYNQKTLAKALGISEGAMLSKLKGRTSFNATEMFCLQKLLEISDSEFVFYFFTPSVVKTQQ